MNKTVTLFGSTGLIGSEVLKLLINDNYFENINIISRKKIRGSWLVEMLVGLIEFRDFFQKNTFIFFLLFLSLEGCFLKINY